MEENRYEDIVSAIELADRIEKLCKWLSEEMHSKLYTEDAIARVPVTYVYEFNKKQKLFDILYEIKEHDNSPARTYEKVRRLL